MKKSKKACRFLLFLAMMLCIICVIDYLLAPKKAPFYQNDHYDVVFFGTSESYCTFDPERFDDVGLVSYNRGRAQQPINLTAYYIVDALDAVDIDVVVLEICGVYSNVDYLDHDMLDSSLNDMRHTPLRYKAALSCKNWDLMGGYMIPLDKYHGNWAKIDWSNPSAFWHSLNTGYDNEDGMRGFLENHEINPAGENYLSKEELAATERVPIPEENVVYLDMIQKACEEHGATLVLTRAPFPFEAKNVYYTNAVKDWGDQYGIELINFMNLTEEIGLDTMTDSLDSGYHLNYSGAEKVSTYMANYLKENYFSEK